MCNREEAEKKRDTEKKKGRVRKIARMGRRGNRASPFSSAKGEKREERRKRKRQKKDHWRRKPLKKLVMSARRKEAIDATAKPLKKIWGGGWHRRGKKESKPTHLSFSKRKRVIAPMAPSRREHWKRGRAARRMTYTRTSSSKEKEAGSSTPTSREKGRKRH